MFDLCGDVDPRRAGDADAGPLSSRDADGQRAPRRVAGGGTGAEGSLGRRPARRRHVAPRHADRGRSSSESPTGTCSTPTASPTSSRRWRGHARAGSSSARSPPARSRSPRSRRSSPRARSRRPSPREAVALALGYGYLDDVSLAARSRVGTPDPRATGAVGPSQALRTRGSPGRGRRGGARRGVRGRREVDAGARGARSPLFGEGDPGRRRRPPSSRDAGSRRPRRGPRCSTRARRRGSSCSSEE